jgi:hypothetical protein
MFMYVQNESRGKSKKMFCYAEVKKLKPKATSLPSTSIRMRVKELTKTKLATQSRGCNIGKSICRYPVGLPKDGQSLLLLLDRIIVFQNIVWKLR